MMKGNDIKQTTDYEQFVIGDWNRTIKPGNLKKIDKSVAKDGWLKHPIIVNEKMEIIDGQHRYVYAKEHGLPVYYLVVNGLGIDDCVTMNNVRTAWSLVDYINFYAKQNIDNYIILQNIVTKYSFASPTTIIGIIKDTMTGGTLLKEVKGGTFTLSTKEYNRAVDVLDFLNDCIEYISRVPGRPTSLLSAFTFAYNCPGVDKKRLRKQIKNNIGIITPPANTDMALKEVERLYNYRNSRGEYIYIYTEYKKRALDRILHGRGKEE